MGTQLTDNCETWLNKLKVDLIMCKGAQVYAPGTRSNLR